MRVRCSVDKGQHMDMGWYMDKEQHVDKEWHSRQGMAWTDEDAGKDMRWTETLAWRETRNGWHKGDQSTCEN